MTEDGRRQTKKRQKKFKFERFLSFFVFLKELIYMPIIANNFDIRKSIKKGLEIDFDTICYVYDVEHDAYDTAQVHECEQYIIDNLNTYKKVKLDRCIHYPKFRYDYKDDWDYNPYYLSNLCISIKSYNFLINDFNIFRSRSKFFYDDKAEYGFKFFLQMLSKKYNVYCIVYACPLACYGIDVLLQYK